jgi:hypothetical protein
MPWNWISLEAGSHGTSPPRPSRQLDISKYIVEFDFGCKGSAAKRGMNCERRARTKAGGPTVMRMSTELIHDVLYSLHQKESIQPDARLNDFDRRCKRIAGFLLWTMTACLIAVAGFVLYVFAADSANAHARAVTRAVLLILVVTTVGWAIVDIAPSVRDLAWLDVFAYQVRQLEAAHDLQQAADLERFGLPALNLTDKSLSLRIERARLRIGMYAGGSDKVAVLAVFACASSVWRGFPDAGNVVEQNLYLASGAFACGTGIAGMFANRMIACMSYQRDLVSMAICRLMNR